MRTENAVTMSREQYDVVLIDVTYIFKFKYSLRVLELATELFGGLDKLMDVVYSFYMFGREQNLVLLRNEISKWNFQQEIPEVVYEMLIDLAECLKDTLPYAGITLTRGRVISGKILTLGRNDAFQLIFTVLNDYF